jgi:hypothetical protein
LNEGRSVFAYTFSFLRQAASAKFLLVMFRCVLVGKGTAMKEAIQMMCMAADCGVSLRAEIFNGRLRRLREVQT